jgi:hypothetical protein
LHAGRPNIIAVLSDIQRATHHGRHARCLTGVVLRFPADRCDIIPMGRRVRLLMTQRLP